MDQILALIKIQFMKRFEDDYEEGEQMFEANWVSVWGGKPITHLAMRDCFTATILNWYLDENYEADGTEEII
jgi:hypothetical protein